MRFPKQLPRFGVEIAHPDLRRIGRLRRPDQPFAVRRKSRALLVIRRWIQPARLAPAGQHDPQMRNLRVRLKIDIDAVEHDPFAIRRRHRRADAFERHHVLECEWMFLRLREHGRRKRKNDCEKNLHEPQSSIELSRAQLDSLSGEHTLPACPSRQLAEMPCATRGRAPCAVGGKLPATTGWQPVLPRTQRAPPLD